MASLLLSVETARRLAVVGQGLSAGPALDGPAGVAARLGAIQRDPTRVVAPTEHLVIWSRLGAWDVAGLDRLLYEEKALFEYWVHILPTADLPLHRPTMRRYPSGDSARSRYVRSWLAGNDGFRRYVLGELRRRGPLRSRDLEDRALVPWRSGGWNDGRSLSRMLDILWFAGKITIVGRDGRERWWDLAERHLPLSPARASPARIARELAGRQLRAAGIARASDIGLAFDGPVAGRHKALERMVREGTAVPAEVGGLPGPWVAHAEILAAPFQPRLTLLSPFDPLVRDRARTERLFGFRFRLEIYQPGPRREHGYFVLPILDGERLIGRVDPAYDRKAGVLRCNAIHAEQGAPQGAGRRVAEAITDLATWIGASRIVLNGTPPAAWRKALRAVS
jgi:uncharacterized protein YcaQ